MATKKRRGKYSELGFGEKAYGKRTRLITPSGEFNVKKSGFGFWQSLDVYHELISMKWLPFILFISLIFLMVNLIFASLYFLAGPEGISGRETEGVLSDYMNAFYFSTQTITTVGFGKLSPNSNAVSVISAIESFIGLLSFAIATGLLYARFSRPRQNIIYSRTALISPYKKGNAMMFRLANKSKNQLIEVGVEVVISYWDSKKDKRIFEAVSLERTKISFLSTSWTVVHPIDENSPIFGWDSAKFDDNQIEVIIMCKAFDDTYVRPVYDRISYDENQIEWAQKFIPMYDRMDDGKIHIHLEKLGATESAKLN